jgi:hypothetical protein
MKNANQKPEENQEPNEEKWESLEKVELEETQGGVAFSKNCGAYVTISAECWGFSCNPFSNVA